MGKWTIERHYDFELCCKLVGTRQGKGLGAGEVPFGFPGRPGHGFWAEGQKPMAGDIQATEILVTGAVRRPEQAPGRHRVSSDDT
jgi:hypothetical protein